MPTAEFWREGRAGRARNPERREQHECSAVSNMFCVNKAANSRGVKCDEFFCVNLIVRLTKTNRIWGSLRSSNHIKCVYLTAARSRNNMELLMTDAVVCLDNRSGHEVSIIL